MIRVVAVITAKPGRRDELLAAFRPMSRRCGRNTVASNIAHADASGVGPVQAKFGPDTFVVLILGGARGVRRHIAAPHMAAYAKKTKDLIASRAIHVLSAIE